MAEHQVTIQDFAFHPAELEIRSGDKVVWTNNDGVVHAVTSTGGAPVEFDVGDLAGGECKAHLFDDVNPGDEVRYICAHHSFMGAKLTVIESA